MKKLLLIIFICICNKSTSQNLVPNPSFEMQLSCPTTPFFSNLLQNWFAPSFGVGVVGSYGYFNSCANIASNASVPLNIGGYELASSGNAYISLGLAGDFFSSFLSNNRAYVAVKLNNNLTANKYYTVSIMYSCTDSAKFATRNFGILFTNSAPQYTIPPSSPSSILPYTPQINNSEFLDFKNGWKKLSWIYIAYGTENYLTLGNFKSNTAADAIISNPQTTAPYFGAIIYIDDVVVEPYNCATGLTKDTTVCNKEILNLQLPANALASYVWQDGTAGAAYSINNAGTYWVTTTAQGCVATDTIKVKYKNAMPFSLGGNKVICNTETITLQVPNIYSSYLWQNGSTAPTLTVKDSGLYYVTATQGKCTYADTIRVTKVNCICDPQIPTAFTPNDDNKNDLFGPSLQCAVKNYAFTVYNRYGQVVFTSTNPTVKWNGTFNNAPSPAGSYVYVLQYTIKGEVILQKQGSFLLVE